MLLDPHLAPPQTYGPPPARTAKPEISVGRAALFGMAWGAAARLWMRFISEDPGFTVGGTAFIVLIPTLISLSSVLAVRSVRWRRAARVPARIAASFSTVLLGVAAGILMMPTLVVLGILRAYRSLLPWPARIVLTVVAAVPVVFVVREIPGGGRIFVALPAYLLLVAAIVPVYARIYHPQPQPSHPRTPEGER